MLFSQRHPVVTSLMLRVRPVSVGPLVRFVPRARGVRARGGLNGGLKGTAAPPRGVVVKLLPGALVLKPLTVEMELSTLGVRWQRSSGKPTGGGDESIYGGGGTLIAASRSSSERIVRRHASGAVILALRHRGDAVDGCVAESRIGVADCPPDCLCEFSSSRSLRATSCRDNLLITIVPVDVTSEVIASARPATRESGLPAAMCEAFRSRHVAYIPGVGYLQYAKYTSTWPILWWLPVKGGISGVSALPGASSTWLVGTRR